MNSTRKTRSQLFRLWKYIQRKRKIQLCLLFVVMLLSGLAELASLGSVLPFLAVLSNPKVLWDIPLVKDLSYDFGITDASDLLIPTTVIFATTAILSAVIRLLNLWLNGKLSALIGNDLSCQAYQRTLYQPYSVHIQRNSSEIITGATTQIRLTIESINGLLQLLTSLIVATGILVGLFIVDAQIAIACGIIFGSCYIVLGNKVRSRLLVNGKQISLSVNSQIKALQEGIGAIRDILLDGNQFTYLEIYRKADRPQRILQAQTNFLIVFPRFALEALGMVVLASLAAFLILSRGSGTSVIPLIGALALGAQRLLPALQQIYLNWSQLKSSNAAITEVISLLEQPLPEESGETVELKVKRNISLNNVSFGYSQDSVTVVKNIDIAIEVGQCIGISGQTGSGKSTIVDIIMGLLSPTSGFVSVDDFNISNSSDQVMHSYRKNIAHVPQSIFLVDGSIAENIAFGAQKDHIDFDLINKVARQSRIHDFVQSLKDSYQTTVGERGVRLSGGQRQRIGIARALYKQRGILILDEATSALDVETEKEVMESIYEYNKDITIIMIAHRLSTLQRCNKIIELQQGRIVNIETLSCSSMD